MKRLEPNILQRDSYQYILKTDYVKKTYWLMLKFNKYAIFSQSDQRKPKVQKCQVCGS